MLEQEILISQQTTTAAPSSFGERRGSGRIAVALSLALILLVCASNLCDQNTRQDEKDSSVSIIGATSDDRRTMLLKDTSPSKAPPKTLRGVEVVSSHQARHISPSPSNTTTLIPDWMKEGHALARAFTPWQGADRDDPYGWCIPQHDEFYAHRFDKARTLTSISSPRDIVQGLIYIKTPKTASSTAVGVTLKIAEKVALRQQQQQWEPTSNHTTTPKHSTSSFIPTCTVNYSHPFAFFKGHGRRQAHKSLLWTTLRHPIQQVTSLFFHFQVSRKGVEPNVTNFISTLQQLQSTQAGYIYPGKVPKANVTHLSVESLLRYFDFIAVADRMDESLVAMKLLYGLEHEDVIVLSSKQAGGYELFEDPVTKQKACRKSVTPFDIEGTQDYLATEFPTNNMDFVLYAAVNQSLDMTIQSLGPERFAQELKIHRKLQALVDEECRPVAQYPCSADGVVNTNLRAQEKDCYVGDSGCGRSCVDRVLHKKFNLLLAGVNVTASMSKRLRTSHRQ